MLRMLDREHGFGGDLGRKCFSGGRRMQQQRCSSLLCAMVSRVNVNIGGVSGVLEAVGGLRW
jgi:hypothetical protein